MTQRLTRGRLFLLCLMLGASAHATRYVELGEPFNPVRFVAYLRDMLATAAALFLLGLLIKAVLRAALLRLPPSPPPPTPGGAPRATATPGTTPGRAPGAAFHPTTASRDGSYAANMWQSTRARLEQMLGLTQDAGSAAADPGVTNARTGRGAPPVAGGASPRDGAGSPAGGVPEHSRTEPREPVQLELQALPGGALLLDWNAPGADGILIDGQGPLPSLGRRHLLPAGSRVRFDVVRAGAAVETTFLQAPVTVGAGAGASAVLLPANQDDDWFGPRAPQLNHAVESRQPLRLVATSVDPRRRRADLRRQLEEHSTYQRGTGRRASSTTPADGQETEA